MTKNSERTYIKLKIDNTYVTYRSTLANKIYKDQEQYSRGISRSTGRQVGTNMGLHIHYKV